ncbi:hypothetical protein Cni_G25773 [Canna indica]|uniref:Adenylyl cyclase-associated protein n=1 Tax=Canna indica TaxID=4628 RepID=A0AAQ3KYI2_9LILI|nr:hypothetical protein Cni_G25773 [Canna indica]
MEKELLTRLEAAVTRLEVLSVARSSPPATPRGLRGAPSALDPSISAFDELVDNYLVRVSAAAAKIGGPVLDATMLVEEAFAVLKQLIFRINQCQKPDAAGITGCLKPLNDVIVKANSLTEGKRSEYFNHLKTAADSLSALAWINYLGKGCGMSMPVAHVEDTWQMAEFYCNKILVEYRNKDQAHVEWAKAIKELYLPGLRDYVKNFYPLGPVWVTNASSPSCSNTKSPATSTPAPPPAPAAPIFTSESAPSHPKVGMSAVFAEINSGKPVTAGLRKVSDDMKTKNRADRISVVATVEKGGHASTSATSKIPPKFELQMGRKWVVENQIGNKSLVIDECDSKQSVYIFGCKDSVLQVKGKVNNITVDKCTKMAVVFTDVVAAFEIVNCNRVEVQCQGSAPSVSLDNTSGCQLYLSSNSLSCCHSIYTAKSTEINVLVPGAGPDSDWVEHSLPEQYVHTYKNGEAIQFVGVALIFLHPLLSSMAKRLIPSFNRVLVEKIVPPSKTSAGILLPEKTTKLNSGKVVAVGPGSLDKNGNRIPVSVNEGETVLLPEYGGTEVKLGEKEYHLYRDEDILGTLRD